MRRSWLLVVSAASLLAAGCDPCSGVVSCEEAPSLSVSGQMVVRETAATVPGVELVFRRVSGVGLAREPVRVVTDSEGRYAFEVEALEEGEVVLDVQVTPPAPWEGYRVTGLRLATSTLRGDGRDLGRWIVDPIVLVSFELHWRYDGSFLVGVPVQFRRTGGETMDPDTISGRTDVGGRFFIRAETSGPGSVLGELVVFDPRLPEPYVGDVGLPTFHEYRPVDVPVGVLLVGPSLLYFGRLYLADGVDRRIAYGSEVEFRRTGGISIEPDTFVTDVKEWGGFPFEATTLHEGSVVGDLIFRPPPPYLPDTIVGVEVSTFNSDEARLLGEWEVTR